MNADIIDSSSKVSKFTDNFNLIKTYHDSLLQSTIVFSQEDYDVGDVIDIAIHLEVNTVKNTENLKFAITDYKNNKFYILKKGYFETITKNDIDDNRNRVVLEDIPLKFIESDPDLVLSNDQPISIYHIKFKLSRKTIGIIAHGKNYPYVIKELIIYSFTNTEKYEYITDYKGLSKPLIIPIKIKSSALKNSEKSSGMPKIKGNPQKLPERVIPKRNVPKRRPNSFDSNPHELPGKKP